MYEIIEKLREYGADMDGAMARFLDDVDLYEACFSSFLSDRAFSMLGEAIAEKDYKKAFECAHTLKGITSNMGLSPLCTVVYSIVDDLRAANYSSLEASYSELTAQLELLKKLHEK
ncbi:MAG: Hpt domain-containing protein [Hydrogenoanaerobacterium sp.]